MVRLAHYVRCSLLAGMLPLLSVGCGSVPFVKQKELPSSWDRLSEKADLYLELVKEETDEFGFVYTSHCDSLLFTSLLAAVGHVAEIEAAREGDRWYRRPSHDCFPLHSGSTISRDMLLGVITWALYTDQPRALSDLADYGRANGWVMGEGSFGATYFTPHMRMILLKAYQALTGESLDVGLAGYLWKDGLGYEAHLLGLQAVILLEADGKVPSEVFQIIKAQYLRHPGNPFRSYLYHRLTDGDFSETIETLLDESHWPSDRLPNYKQHCDEWVVQRELGPDWLPCKRKRQHVGGELIFITKLIEKGV